MSGGGGGGEAPSVASSLPAFYYAVWLLLRDKEGEREVHNLTKRDRVFTPTSPSRLTPLESRGLLIEHSSKSRSYTPRATTSSVSRCTSITVYSLARILSSSIREDKSCVKISTCFFLVVFAFPVRLFKVEL